MLNARGLHSPEDILGAAAGPARAGTVGKPWRAQEVAASHPMQPHGVWCPTETKHGEPPPKLRVRGDPITRAKHRTRRVPGCLCTEREGVTPRGGPRDASPLSPPGPGDRSTQRGRTLPQGDAAVQAEGVGGGAGGAALCPSVSFYGADNEELQE